MEGFLPEWFWLNAVPIYAAQRTGTANFLPPTTETSYSENMDTGVEHVCNKKSMRKFRYFGTEVILPVQSELKFKQVNANTTTTFLTNEPR